MPNRLEPINIVDYTGGINLRRSQFQLADNESPDLLNVDIDPRGGFMTRKGWERWNENDIVDMFTTAWEPRNAFAHVWADNNEEIYIVNEGVLYSASGDGVFTVVTGITAEASPHGADFAAWGDDLYIVSGRTQNARRRSLDGATVSLSPSTWSEIDTPTNNTMPASEFCETHAGYMFVGSTREAAVDHDDRIRWSHPGDPDSWREDDFLDITEGGGRITGLMSFGDHLLIFKTTSIHALYGYDEGSWQRVKVSDHIGCPAITAATRSESAVYFYSTFARGGIYIYSGDRPEYISEQVSVAFEEIINYENIFVSWAGRRLWVAVPWTKGIGSTVGPSAMFVYNNDIGSGAWVMYNSNCGSASTILDGADVNFKYPLAAFWCTHAATMVSLDHLEDAFDMIWDPPSLWAMPDVGYIVTDADEEIGVTGGTVGQPFTTYYRTRWLHAGWPDRKKSWRRPTFICRETVQDAELLVETYRDYDETNVHRTRTLRIEAGGGAYWTEEGAADPDGLGFDWSEDGIAPGAFWGAGTGGTRLVRAGSIGLARSVQMKVSPSPVTVGRSWGVDGIVAKFVQRRFR